MTPLPALAGGEPVRRRPWPTWPMVSPETEKVLSIALRSGRWALSGPFLGELSFEKRFANAFARFNGVSFCVPTANGSSALLIALQALGVKYGDEVLVPGLTWVACASSVLACGAVPILVDAEPATLCMSPVAARAAITPRTRAILLVHLYGSLVDLMAFLKLSEETGIPLVEDCSHVHGALWRGRRVGSFSEAATFSMQQSKLLTSGEGGAVITSSPSIYDHLQQLRADGRRYVSDPEIGELEISEVGRVQGRNYCLSEIHAALLWEQLSLLDFLNARRQSAAERLNTLLAQIDGVTCFPPQSNVDLQTYYGYCVRLDCRSFGGAGIGLLARALSAEIGCKIKPIYRPLPDSPLYNPLAASWLPLSDELRARLDPSQFDLPVARQAAEECLVIPHHLLLADVDEISDVAVALKKIRDGHRYLAT
jgi:dTDP-4-amino-4,6-dideoxygalactose transaminase